METRNDIRQKFKSKFVELKTSKYFSTPSRNDKLTKPRLLGLARFESLDQFLATYNTIPNYFTRNCRDDVSANDTWTYGREIPTKPSREAYSDLMLKNGDVPKNLMQYIEEYREKLSLEGLEEMSGVMKSCKRKRVYRDRGSRVDIARYLSGDENVWTNLSQKGKKKFITLGVQVSLSSGNGLKTYCRNMALAYVICQLLESKGYGVCIDIISSAYTLADESQLKGIISKEDNLGKIDFYGGSEVGQIFRVKHFEESTDLRNIACASLPSILRKYNLTFDEILWGHSTGRCSQTSNEFISFANVDMLVSHQWTEEGQFDNVVQAIKELMAE